MGLLSVRCPLFLRVHDLPTYIFGKGFRELGCRNRSSREANCKRKLGTRTVPGFRHRSAWLGASANRTVRQGRRSRSDSRHPRADHLGQAVAALVGKPNTPRTIDRNVRRTGQTGRRER